MAMWGIAELRGASGTFGGSRSAADELEVQRERTSRPDGCIIWWVSRHEHSHSLHSQNGKVRTK